MNRKTKKRALRIRLAIIYTTMALAVVAIVAGTYLVIQGYRFNRYDGRLEQGGLVQFNSNPSGADVWLDSIRLANKTASKLTISTGQHAVSMTKAGYEPWKRTVTVRAGAVLWLDYIRLVPSDLKTSVATQFTGVQSGVRSPDGRRIALVEDTTQPTVTTVTVDSDTPQKKSLTLTTAQYTAPAAGESQAFAVVAYAADNHYLLVKHTYGIQTEWLSIDTTGSAVKNITKLLGVEAAEVQYSPGDANTLFVLTNTGEVRRANVDQKVLSGPLLSAVESYNMYDANTIVYTTKAGNDGVRTAGYLTVGAASPRVIYQTKAGDTQALQAKITKYYGKYYQVVAHGGTVMIYSGDLSASDAKSPEALVKIDSFTIDGGALYIGASPEDHRFVYAQNNQQVVTYDLDLLTTHPLALTAGTNSRITWVDQFHYVVNDGAVLWLYDYDGTNGHAMVTAADSNLAALTPNGKYLYGLNAATTGVSLTQVKMTTD